MEGPEQTKSGYSSSLESDEEDFEILDSNTTASSSDSEGEMNNPSPTDLTKITKDKRTRDTAKSPSISPENLEKPGRTRSGRVYRSPTPERTEAEQPQKPSSSSIQSGRLRSSKGEGVAKGNHGQPKTDQAIDNKNDPQQTQPKSGISFTPKNQSKMIGTFFAEKKVFVISFVVVVIGIVIAFKLANPTPPLITPNHRIQYFNGKFKELNKKYDMTKQYPETILHFRAAIESSIEEKEPKFPSTMVVLLPPKIQLTSTTCYLSELGKIVNQAFNSTLPPKILNSNYFASAGKDIHWIHKDLKKYFNQSGKVVIVQDVTQLTVLEHLLVFHAFCDDFLAPEPRAIFFFPVPITPEAYDKRQWKPKQALALADRVLSQSWSEVLTADTIDALTARVARSAVMIKEPIKCGIW